MQALERFFKIQFEVIIDQLKKELDHLCEYHNARHTLDVIEQTQVIGKTENLSEKELLLLRIASLFHDTGFFFQRAKHEEQKTQIYLNKIKRLFHNVYWLRACHNNLFLY